MKKGYDIFSSLHVMQLKNLIFKLVSKYCQKIHDNLGLLHGQKTTSVIWSLPLSPVIVYFIFHFMCQMWNLYN